MNTLEQKNRYMKHQVAILEAILKNNQPSSFSTGIDPNSEYFEDSCRHAHLYHSVYQLVDTFKSMIKYNEIIIAAEREQG